MASNELIIDDDYCKSMGTYFTKQGQQLDQMISDYVTILQDVRNKAILSGDVATALSAYITYAEKLKQKIGNVSTNAGNQITTFLSKVDAADQYLF